MSYVITLRDKTEIIVADEAGQKLSKALMTNDKDKPEYITLAGSVYRTSLVVSVTKSNIVTPDFTRPALPKGPIYNCVAAGTSIQYAIHQLILSKHPRDWPKFVRDRDYRERMRLALRAKYPKRDWCDNHVNEHACLLAKS